MMNRAEQNWPNVSELAPVNISARELMAQAIEALETGTITRSLEYESDIEQLRRLR